MYSLNFLSFHCVKKTNCFFVIGALHGGINAIARVVSITQINYIDVLGLVGLLIIFSIITLLIINYILSVKFNL